MLSRTMRVLLVTLVALVAFSVAAQASMKIQKDFLAKYPEAAKFKNPKCLVCHTPGKATKDAPLLNAYGTDLKTAELKYEGIEAKDSDQDGTANLAEIKAATNPGEAPVKALKAAKGLKVAPKADKADAKK
jgi:hypothetical protein